VKCIRCDHGRVEELLPAHANPDDSMTRVADCDECDGTGELPLDAMLAELAASERAVKAYVAKYMDTEHKPCKYGVPPCPRCAEWGKIFWSKERVLKAITEYAMTEYI
jgi:hypothetical protein